MIRSVIIIWMSYLSHVVSDIKVHIHSNDKFNEILCETKVLMNNSKMERPRERIEKQYH